MRHDAGTVVSFMALLFRLRCITIIMDMGSRRKDIRVYLPQLQITDTSMILLLLFIVDEGHANDLFTTKRVFRVEKRKRK